MTDNQMVPQAYPLYFAMEDPFVLGLVIGWVPADRDGQTVYRPLCHTMGEGSATGGEPWVPEPTEVMDFPPPSRRPRRSWRSIPKSRAGGEPEAADAARTVLAQ